MACMPICMRDGKTRREGKTEAERERGKESGREFATEAEATGGMGVGWWGGMIAQAAVARCLASLGVVFSEEAVEPMTGYRVDMLLTCGDGDGMRRLAVEVEMLRLLRLLRRLFVASVL